MCTFTRVLSFARRQRGVAIARPHLVCVGVVVRGRCCAPLSVRQDSSSPPHYSNPHRHCRRKQSKRGRSSMAGRYDSNPFEEEDVNPFSVRPPQSSTPSSWRSHHCPGGRSTFLFLPGIRYFAPVWIWTGRRSNHVPAMEKQMHIPRCSITDAASGFFF